MLANEAHEGRNAVSSVLTVNEVAEELRCGRNQAYELVNSGELHSVRIGRAIRVPRWALEEYLGRPERSIQGAGASQ